MSLETCARRLDALQKRLQPSEEVIHAVIWLPAKEGESYEDAASSRLPNAGAKEELLRRLQAHQS